MLMLKIRDRLCRRLVRPVFLSHTSNENCSLYILGQAQRLRFHSAEMSTVVAPR